MMFLHDIGYAASNLCGVYWQAAWTWTKERDGIHELFREWISAYGFIRLPDGVDDPAKVPLKKWFKKRRERESLLFFGLALELKKDNLDSNGFQSRNEWIYKEHRE